MESKKLHRAWIILVGCCFLMMTLALLTTCMSFFLQPVSDDLGFERGAFSIYYSIAGLVGVVAMPVWGRLIPKWGIKKAVVIGGIGGALFMFLLGVCRTLPAFYATGLLMGIMIAGLTVLPTSILINTWFEEKRGMAMGIAMAFSGVGGAIFSPIISNIIETYGWQTGYMFNGALIFLFTVPIGLFLLKGNPAEVGLKPYGAQETPASEEEKKGAEDIPGVPASIATKSSSLIALAVAVVILNMIASSLQHLPGHLLNTGIEAQSASFIVSLVMIIVIVSKILLGILNDRFGPIISTAGALTLMGISFLLFATISDYKLALFAAVIYGVGLAAVTVIPPLITGQMYGQKDYSAIYAIIGAMGSLGLALGTPAIGFVFDKTGSYDLAFYGCIVAIVLVLVLMVYARNSSKKLWGAPTPELKHSKTPKVS
jgi:MFS family permease